MKAFALDFLLHFSISSLLILNIRRINNYKDSLPLMGASIFKNMEGEDEKDGSS